MNEIGGFFELELQQSGELHRDAIKLNTGRNCLEYILKAKDYNKIYIPYFSCDVLLEPIIKTGIEYEFFRLDIDLNPIFDYNKLNNSDAFLYVNYFGIKQNTVLKLSRKIKNLIVDNTQAFYSKPLINIDTFYSPRKFFGVADGGYLYTDKILDIELENDLSFDKMDHLLKRIDLGAEKSYTEFKDNSNKLKDCKISEMSNLTSKILNSINYKEIKEIREGNFIYLHSTLKDFNLLDLNTEDLNGPLTYPFMTKDDSLRQHLINNKIFVATYWPNVFDWCKTSDLEYKLSKCILPLPIDQRYSKDEMDRILSIIRTRIFK